MKQRKLDRTPRTDSAANGTPWPPLHFTRGLERECNHLAAENEYLRATIRTALKTLIRIRKRTPQ
jgi:hypothetical protein